MYHIQTCYKRTSIFQASICSWAGGFESHFVRNPEGRFSRDKAHIIVPAKINDNLINIGIIISPAWHSLYMR